MRAARHRRRDSRQSRREIVWKKGKALAAAIWLWFVFWSRAMYLSCVCDGAGCWWNVVIVYSIQCFALTDQTHTHAHIAHKHERALISQVSMKLASHHHHHTSIQFCLPFTIHTSIYGVFISVNEKKAHSRSAYSLKLADEVRFIDTPNLHLCILFNEQNLRILYMKFEIILSRKFTAFATNDWPVGNRFGIRIHEVNYLFWMNIISSTVCFQCAATYA